MYLIESSYEAIARLVGFLLVLILLLFTEFCLPNRQRDYSVRARSNLYLQGFNFLLQGLIPVSMIGAVYYTVQHRTGLFYSSFGEMGLWSKIIICWIAIDLAMYWLHRAYHGFGFLWRIHRVHHGDPSVDLTTAFRTHPLETLITLGVRAGIVVILGAPLLGIIIYEVVVAGMALFIHGNFRIDPRLDRLMQWLVVTPKMHEIHHGGEPKDYQSNFGLVVSFWDRLFGTYRGESAVQETNKFGLDSLNSSTQQTAMVLLKMPFTYPDKSL